MNNLDELRKVAAEKAPDSNIEIIKVVEIQKGVNTGRQKTAEVLRALPTDSLETVIEAQIA